MLQDSLYHSLLRVATLTCALVLLFESGLIDPATKELSDNARHYVATAIGVSAMVDPNELNVITAELAKQRQSLNEREAALAEREINVGLGQTSATNSALSTWILSAVLFILLVLIILNYVLDFLRRQTITSSKEGQLA